MNKCSVKEVKKISQKIDKETEHRRDVKAKTTNNALLITKLLFLPHLFINNFSAKANQIALSY